MRRYSLFLSSFFFNDTATTEIYTLSLHDALPIFPSRSPRAGRGRAAPASLSSRAAPRGSRCRAMIERRSEEHTSELQSLRHLVCRLLLEKKKKRTRHTVETRDLIASQSHSSSDQV